jgi:hypothetical protein
MVMFSRFVLLEDKSGKQEHKSALFWGTVEKPSQVETAWLVKEQIS